MGRSRKGLGDRNSSRDALHEKKIVLKKRKTSGKLIIYKIPSAVC